MLCKWRDKVLLLLCFVLHITVFFVITCFSLLFAFNISILLLNLVRIVLLILLDNRNLNRLLLRTNSWRLLIDRRISFVILVVRLLFLCFANWFVDPCDLERFGTILEHTLSFWNYIMILELFSVFVIDGPTISFSSTIEIWSDTFDVVS